MLTWSYLIAIRHNGIHGTTAVYRHDIHVYDKIGAAASLILRVYGCKVAQA